jgi:casein kinase 1
MQLVGENLDGILRNRKKFSMESTVEIARQILDRLETLHELDYLHLDLKPENFCVSKNPGSHTIYLIDFGSCLPYRDSEMQVHKKESRSQRFVGSLNFSSLNIMNKLRPSRRDDLESWFYCLIYLMQGRLPWTHVIKSGDFEESFPICQQLKHSVAISDLCASSPVEFQNIFSYIRSLAYE